MEQYTGTYRNEDMQLELKVEWKIDGLIIFGGKRLRPHSSSVFYIDDMSVTISFDFTNDYWRMLITEKDNYANRADEGTLFLKL